MGGRACGYGGRLGGCQQNGGLRLIGIKKIKRMMHQGINVRYQRRVRVHGNCKHIQGGRC
jgi:hypothetical protein